MAKNLNQDDLEEIFANKKSHKTFGHTKLQDVLAEEFEVENDDGKFVRWKEVEYTSRCLKKIKKRYWNKFRGSFMDMVRHYSSTDHCFKTRQKLKDELAKMLVDGANGERTLQYAISARNIKSDQMERVRTNTYGLDKLTARQLAKKQGVVEENEDARIQLIYKWWAKSRKIKSEAPKHYLHVKIPETATVFNEETKKYEPVAHTSILIDMYSEGALIADIARKYDAINNAVECYISELKTTYQNNLRKKRRLALESSAHINAS